jgi:uncharacterized protein (DUF302 family)
MKELTTIADAKAAAFVLNCRFDAALARVRQAIRGGGLSIAAEIDAARRVKRALHIRVSPCRILLVDNPFFMLQATSIDRASGVLIPLHVVVSAAGSRTIVHLLNLASVQTNELSIGVRAPLVDLRNELFRVLAGVADTVHLGRDSSEERAAFTLG